MKLSGWILRASLIAMVALSLVFSFLIWQNPSRLGRSDTSVAVKTTKDPNAAAQVSNVFAPTTAYYQHDGTKTMLFDPETSVADTLRTAMKEWQIQRIGAAKKLTSSAYTALLATDQSLQLRYTGAMAFKQFNQTFLTQPLKSPGADFQFDRLLVDLSATTTRLQFVNDKTRAVRTATLAHADVAKVQAVVAKTTASGFAVTEMRLGNRQVATFNAPIQVPPYTFLLDQQSANHFVSLLLPADSASSVDTREIGTETVYTLGASQRLSLDTDTGGMQYENAAKATAGSGLTTSLRTGYASLSKLALQGLGTVRYFDTQSDTGTVTFRACALGLPIFNADGYGAITTTNTASGEQMGFSTYNLTVAIPTTQSPVTLPSTATVFDQLRHAGYDVNGLTDMTLGYYWKAQTADSQVVSLTPTYFVKINGEYRRYTQWVDPTDETAKDTVTPSNGSGTQTLE
ncbi:YycH family regulatory protein [Lacticaseibacillus daqingensis]|uniref:YycH family regulatory protein n=1 Tax=Lacticaseibacillus daqingensis TaxID=2486014 RepID=UPI000F769198|nr:two-component system activity regulator YycH [Lacticaseibacillus daqingensis]